MVIHPHARTTWTTARIDRSGKTEIVLVVETDLATSTFEEGFDEKQFGGLVNAITATLKANPLIGRAEVERIRMR